MKWIKASASRAGGACVEVAPVDGGVAVRDSKDNGQTHQPYLFFYAAEWVAFRDAVKAGEFDHL